ncbi:DUF3300 domain-containing protein [Variovorax robiniae]|uniref:DUF3300 domain-containing protein n=1 Tax=Variovorax robiniae TaxID=1836199 RepID=A0ABU8XBQ1_9BURK
MEAQSKSVITAIALAVMAASCTAPVTPGPTGGAPPPSTTSVAAGGSQQGTQVFSEAQIDQMMAPIALYPDSLLSQVLMASTYPADVVEAAKWSAAHPDQNGDAAAKAVESQPWDPSVKSLIAFPQVIQMMGDKPDWVQNLGDAFLASSKDVLDSAQRLRTRAQASGNLQSSAQQKVSVTADAQSPQSVITIEPADPQVVYVPTYNPAIVYGTWPYPAYPPYLYYPPAYYYPGAALASGIAFGIGVAAIGALWGNCNWGGGSVNINAARFNSINVNRQISGNQAFQHNAANRRGVPYRDSRSQQRFGGNVPGAEQRGDFRGRADGSRDAQRQQAQSAMQQRGMDPGQARNQLRNDPGTRERAQAAAQGRPGGDFGGGDRMGNQGLSNINSRGGMGGDNAFRGAGNASQMQRQMDRGGASRQSMQQHGGFSGGGARMGGGGARMGGGGRGGRR